MPKANSKYYILFCLGILINSTILAGSTKFLGNLSHFLSPAQQEIIHSGCCATAPPRTAGLQKPFMTDATIKFILWSSSKMASSCLEDTTMFHGVNITFLKLKKQPCSYFEFDLFALLSLLTVSVIVIAFSYCFLFFLLFLHSFENRIIIP